MLRYVGKCLNCKYHSSGHIYFTLKDETGVLKAIMFRTQAARGLAFSYERGRPCCGDRSDPDLRERRKISALCGRNFPGGRRTSLSEIYGDRRRNWRRWACLRRSTSVPIPRFASRVGVVTAPTGAADPRHSEYFTPEEPVRTDDCCIRHWCRAKDAAGIHRAGHLRAGSRKMWM